MVYNDTTNKNGLLQRCEFWTDLGDATISGTAVLKAQFTQSLNNWYHKVVTMILNSQDEWDFDDSNHTDFPILTTSLVANQQDYSIPASEKVLKIKRIEVSYDGTNWNKAEPLDIGEIGDATNTTTIAGSFSKSEPYYDIQYGSIFLYPIPDTAVTGGLKVWWTREIDEFTTSDTTQEPGIDEPFHEMLPLGASFDYCVAKGLSKKNDIFTVLQDYEARLKQFYGSKQKDRKYAMKPTNINYE